MFNWLKQLFKLKSTISEEAGVFPFPTAKGQDQSSLAPYKVEVPVVEAAGNETSGNNTLPTAPKKPSPKKKPVAGKQPAGARGRKPKVKSALK